MVYFTSDLHLGHKNIIKLCNRPFSSVEEMDERLIANWNDKVKENDTVYVLGDLIYKSSDNPEKYLSRLKGKKILLVGNHDDGWLHKINANKYFIQIQNMIVKTVNGRLITLCHYPLLDWKNSKKSSINKIGYMLYGHLHNNRIEKAHAFNVGVDVNNFQPISFNKLIKEEI